jgi:hypothetical protein
MGAESVIIIKQNKYIEVFNDLAAIDSQHSIDLDDVDIRRSNIFNRMAV